MATLYWKDERGSVSYPYKSHDLWFLTESVRWGFLLQAGIVTRTPQGGNVYYQIADLIAFELCELVCDRLSIRLDEQAKQIAALQNLRDRLMASGCNMKSF